jgi:hypothetical protein
LAGCADGSDRCEPGYHHPVEQFKRAKENKRYAESALNESYYRERVEKALKELKYHENHYNTRLAEAEAMVKELLRK